MQEDWLEDVEDLEDAGRETEYDCSEYRPLARLWCLRAIGMLIRAGADPDPILTDEDVIRLLGATLGEEAQEPPKTFNRRFKETALRQVSEMLAEVEAAEPAPKGALFDNLRLLGEALGLKAVELEVLGLLAVARHEFGLGNALESGGRLSDGEFGRLVARMLGREAGEVGAVLAPGGPLATTMLIELNDSKARFCEKATIHKQLSSALMRANASAEELFSFATTRAPAARLALADYEHVGRDLEVLLPYLGCAAKEGRAGVNVLLYGGAGNGKTELARLLAHEAGLTLYEVRHSSPDGQPIVPGERIGSYAMVQALLRHQRQSAILFDEIEDVLPRMPLPWFDGDRESLRRKAWFNHTLESNPVPAIWIGNQVAHVDPALLRRFDYVLELGPPPRAARLRMLREHLGGLAVSEAWLERTADDRSLSPGIVARISRVLSSLGPCEAATLESRFDRMARAHQQAKGEVPPGRYPYPERYRVELLNASADPLSVARRLGERGRGTLLLYGPPGTGKTAYAHFVARTLGQPLLVRRASDLLSMWFGETEKLICAMFAEAAAERAVLLLDEADSFLQDRRSARHSWEVTQVNELLTRMEEFEGVFVCATNFAEHLDAAAMRRFALKVEFRPLAREQARLAFADTLAAIGIGAAGGEAGRPYGELDRLEGLTPGDFAVAQKALDLGAYPRTPEGLVAALRGELAAKPEGRRRPIGFTA